MTAPRLLCQVSGCRLTVRPCHRVCSNHWRQIPVEMRAVLVEAFRNRHTDRATHLRARAVEVELAETYQRRAVSA